MRLSHGNFPGKRNNVAFRSNVFENIPTAALNTRTNSFTSKLSHPSVCSNGYTTDLSEYPTKSDCFSERSFMLDSSANNNGCSERLNSELFNIDKGVPSGNWMAEDARSYQRRGSDNDEKKFAFQNTKAETLYPSAIAYEEKKRWNLNYTQSEHLSMRENSCTMPEKKDMKNMNFQKGIQTYPKEFYFPKNLINSYHNGGDFKSGMDNAVELTPINPGKIFGQCRFQTTANDMHVEEKYSYAEPMGQITKWQNPSSPDIPLLQAQKAASIRNKKALNDVSLVVEPSSPIANLSNLVAKIHQDHRNIMTGKNNPKVEGK